MYQDFENKKLRNLTPEEVCAMYHFHDEYARLGIGAIAFYASLTQGNKNFIARMVSDVVKHCPTMRAPDLKRAARKSKHLSKPAVSGG